MPEEARSAAWFYVRVLHPLIFAGSYEQARHFAQHNLGLGPGEWTYLLPHAGRGHRAPTVYCVGTYFARPDFQEVMTALIPAHPTFLGEDGEEMVP